MDKSCLIVQNMIERDPCKNIVDRTVRRIEDAKDTEGQANEIISTAMRWPKLWSKVRQRLCDNARQKVKDERKRLLEQQQERFRQAED